MSHNNIRRSILRLDFVGAGCQSFGGAPLMKISNLKGTEERHHEEYTARPLNREVEIWFSPLIPLTVCLKRRRVTVSVGFTFSKYLRRALATSMGYEEMD